MTPDPYPDDPLVDAQVVRAELSEADSRLLAALSRPGPPVVTAVEDELRDQDGVGGRPVGRLSAAAGRGPVVPVFQEPSG